MTQSPTTTPTEKAMLAFDDEAELRQWVAEQWDAGRLDCKDRLAHGKPARKRYAGFSRPWVAGYEAQQLLAAAQEVPAGYTLGSQIRQHEDLYRVQQAERLIADSAKASMRPLMNEHVSDELDEAMGVICLYGRFDSEGTFGPALVRPLDADAVPLARAKDISIDAARELVARRYIEMAADRKLTSRIDMRFDLGVDLLAPQIVFAKVPQASNAWLARGERTWAFWYVPEIWQTRDGAQRTSWYHAGDWSEEIDGVPSKFNPGVWGCVAVFTDEGIAARAQTALLRAVLTVRRISAELAAGSEYEDDPVQRVGLDGEAPKPTTRKPQIFEI